MDLGTIEPNTHQAYGPKTLGSPNLEGADAQTKLSFLSFFLTMIRYGREGDQLNLDTDDRRLVVDQIREVFPELIPPYTYTWNSAKEIEELQARVEHEMTLLTPKENASVQPQDTELGSVFCSAHEKLYSFYDKKVDEIISEIELNNKKSAALTKFMSLANAALPQKKLELAALQTEDTRKTIQDIKTFFPELISSDEQTWSSEEEVKSLIEMVSWKIKQVTQENNSKTPFIQERFLDRKRANDCFYELLKQWREMVSRFTERQNNHV